MKHSEPQDHAYVVERYSTLATQPRASMVFAACCPCSRSYRPTSSDSFKARLRVFFLVVKCLPKRSTERMKIQFIKLLWLTGRGLGVTLGRLISNNTCCNIPQKSSEISLC